MSWFLLQTKSRQEENVERRLKRDGIEPYLPMAAVDKLTYPHARNDKEPMFFSYVFFVAEKGFTDFHPISKIPGVLRIIKGPDRDDLGRPCLLPTKIHERVILDLKARENENGIHEIHQAEYFYGDRVRIISGVYHDYDGIVQKIVGKNGKERALILLQTIAGERKAEVYIKDFIPAT